jgi:hypothetical protein
LGTRHRPTSIEETDIRVPAVPAARGAGGAVNPFLPAAVGLEAELE